MKINVGKMDGYLRMGLGVLLLSLWFFDPTHLVWLVGVVPIVTGFINFCPIYRLFGISTCPLPPGTISR